MEVNFGFSFRGLIIFLMPMIPNFFYLLMPYSSAAKGKQNKHLFLDILEHGSQAVFIFLLVFTVNSQSFELLTIYSMFMAAMLILYYILWSFYFFGRHNMIILLGLAIVPVIYFILGELWLLNYWAVVPTVIFGIVHVVITLIDYRSL